MAWARKKNEDGLRCALMRAIPYTRLPLDYWSYRVPAQKRNMWQMQWSTIMSTLGRAAAAKCFDYQQRSGGSYRQRDFAAGRYGTGKSKRADSHSQIGGEACSACDAFGCTGSGR